MSREASPCSESPRPVSIGSESPNENICTNSNQINNNNNASSKVTHSTGTNTQNSNVNNKISNHVMNNSGSGRSLHSQNKSVGVSYPILLVIFSVLFSFYSVLHFYLSIILFVMLRYMWDLIFRLLYTKYTLRNETSLLLYCSDCHKLSKNKTRQFLLFSNLLVSFSVFCYCCLTSVSLLTRPTYPTANVDCLHHSGEYDSIINSSKNTTKNHKITFFLISFLSYENENEN